MSTTAAPTSLAFARYLAQAGQYAQAESALRGLIELAPGNVDALCLLGRVRFLSGDPAGARKLMERAVAATPDRADVQLELATLLGSIGDYPAAARHLARVVDLRPNDAEPRYHLGCALAAAGANAAAVEWLESSLALAPDVARAWVRLGNVHLVLERWADADAAFVRARALQADIDPVVLVSHSGALHALGRVDEARAAIYEAIRRGNRLEAPRSLANIDQSLAWCEASERCLLDALAVDPGHPELMAALACVVERRNGLSELVVSLIDAAAVHNDHAGVMSWAGLAIISIRDISDEAVAILKHAAALDSRSSRAMNALGWIALQRGELEEAADWFRKVLQVSPCSPLAHSNLLFTLRHASILSREELFEEHRRFGETYEALYRPLPPPALTAADAERRLRIGFISPDFRLHAVPQFFEPYLEHLDRSKFEVFLYYADAERDAVTARLKAKADHWREFHGTEYHVAAQAIRDDRIDLLVDLAGHTAKNMLPVFALKPAPLQFTWIGYPGTTGLSRIDYRITGVASDPPGEAERYHTEKLLYLNKSTFRPSYDVPVSPPPSLTAGHVTFGCFNKPLKASQKAFDTWAAIMAAVPDSRMLVIAADGEALETRKRFHAALGKSGMDLERVTIIPRQTPRDFMLRFADIDIALDPFPYSGGTTSLITAWMGVPLVTLDARTSEGATTAAVLQALGLSELVARDAEEYCAKAVALATDPARLTALRAELRPRALLSAFMDEAGCARELETLMQTVWRQHVQATVAAS